MKYRIQAAVAAMTMMAAWAQPPAAPAKPQGPQGPVVISPEVSERKVTFRILAPQAEAVKLNAGDIPNSQGATMTKGSNGVWEVTLGPLEPGAYRYSFNVGGVTVIDPRSAAVSESNNNLWSLVVVPGSDAYDEKQVPHGAVAEVHYWSTALNKFRRMHVYTPPGYELGKGKYPVFFLLHGASDSDDSWTSVGRANFIIDNLIAAGKAKPMIVVMPAGHTRTTMTPRAPGGAGGQPPRDEFVDEFLKDIRPTVEKNYRVLKGRQFRAIAGLSMGGNQTLNIAIPDLKNFSYVGVYSSGLIGSFGTPRAGAAPAAAQPQTPRPSWEEQHAKELDDAVAKKGLKLVWFATGKEDFLLKTSQGTVEMLKKHGFTVTYNETSGAHTWLNWRIYLSEFAPLLFK